MTLLLLAANLAFAAGDDNQGNNNQVARIHEAHNHEPRRGQQHDHRTVSAPEIDLGQALGGIALLSGAIAVIRGYRRNKK